MTSRANPLRRLAAVLLLAFALAPRPAQAEVSEFTVGQQFALSFLPLMLMEHAGLIEKHAAALGLPKPKVTWAKLGGPSSLNEGMVSGAIQFAGLGPPSAALLWDKTRGDVKVISAICSYPIYLNARGTGVASLKDFGERDRIALTSVKISYQAILLQMQAEKEFGPGQHGRIDRLTVSLANPDGMAALLGNTEVTAHFTPAPFHQTEIKDPRIRTVMTSYDILGGPGSAVVLIASERFRRANPKTFAAVSAAAREAIDILNADKKAAAELYLKLAGGKTSVAELEAILTDPSWSFTATPQKVEKAAQFMHRIGSIKTPVTSWKQLFFEEAHGLPGD